MERKDQFFYYVPDVESSCGSNNMEEGSSSSTSSRTAPSNSNNGGTAVPPMQKEDLRMPTDVVIKIMQKILPPHATISNDAMDTIQKCLSKFITFITNEANKERKSEQRKDITVNDLLLAMENVGLNDYIDPLIAFYDRYLQNEVEGYIGGAAGVSANDVMPLPPPPPPQQSVVVPNNGYDHFPSTSSMNPRVFNPMGMGELNKGGSSGASTSGTKSFDPLAFLEDQEFYILPQ